MVRCNSNPFRILCRLFLVTIIGLVGSDFFVADAYRVGDTVDSVISTRSAISIDLLIANKPLFGVTKTVHLPRGHLTFSLSFEDGLHALPYVDAASTEKLIVTFVYSKSGAGRIHSVSSKVIRSSSPNKRFTGKQEVEVLYDWVEEAAVDLEAGSIVVFLVVFLVSVLFVLQLCAIDHDSVGDDDEDDDDYRTAGYNNSYYKGR